jgi:tetratricopeptide (TPR) repeat protein
MSFNDWEYEGWLVGEEDWPLANLVWPWLEERRIAEILDDPVSMPPERSLQYLVLRRLWRSGLKSSPILEALRRLIERAAPDPAMALLHDRAMLVFERLWKGLGMEWRHQSAAAVFEVLRQIGEEHGFPPLGGPQDGLDGPPPEEARPDPDAGLPPAARARARRIRSLRSRLAHNPQDVEAWMDLAGLYREAAEIDAALDAYAQAARHHALFALPYYHRGKIFMERKNYASAREEFSKAIILFEERGGRDLYLTHERPPNEYVDAYRTRGVAWFHELNHAKGLADLSVAIELRRDDARLVWERGYLHEKANLKDLAVEDYYRAGELYLDRGDTAKTSECAAALDRLGAADKARALRPAPVEAPGSDLP